VRDRTIITAAYRRRIAGELHDETSGDQMDLMNGEEGPNNPFRSRTVQL
jgi:hypothetical protein